MSSNRSSATRGRRPKNSCWTYTTRARPSCPVARGKRWNAMCRFSTPTACGRRSSRTRSSEAHEVSEAARVTSGFSSGKGGVVVAEFEAAEVSLLRSLVSMMLGIVEPGRTSDDPLERALGIGGGEAPTDPVLARLFPSAYEDEKDSAEFR